MLGPEGVTWAPSLPFNFINFDYFILFDFYLTRKVLVIREGFLFYMFLVVGEIRAYVDIGL